MRTLIAALFAAGSVVAASNAQAAVRYDFEITSPYDVSFYSALGTVTGKFTYISTDFLNLGSPDAVVFFADDLVSCEATSSTASTATCGYAFFSRSYLTDPVYNFSQVQLAIFADGNGAGINAYFADGAFVTAGTHLTDHSTVMSAQAKLVVTVLPDAVPEPSSWAMMIGGLALVGASMRRCKVAVSYT
jgi:hypothetical protein